MTNVIVYWSFSLFLLSRTPYGLWRKILEDTELMANARLKVSQTLTTDISESIKNLKTERATTIKKVWFSFLFTIFIFMILFLIRKFYTKVPIFNIGFLIGFYRISNLFNNYDNFVWFFQCSSLNEKLHEELVTSATEMVKVCYVPFLKIDFNPWITRIYEQYFFIIIIIKMWFIFFQSQKTYTELQKQTLKEIDAVNDAQEK